MADTVTPVNALMKNVNLYQYNPALIQRSVMQTLTDVSDGTIEIVDPTNPFVFLMESAAVLTAAAMIKNEVNTRKQYPYSAQDEEDLYLHMSDKDYIGRFATPSTTKFSILMPKEELLSRMVLDVATGIKKLVIPRNTFFTIADTIFSIQYPIEIRQLIHGGLQVVYDATVTSPLQSLTTNEIPFSERQTEIGTWLFFEVDVQQFSIISQTNTISSAVDFSQEIVLENNYYYARVYLENAVGKWVEIPTTHTAQIYDPAQPTAVLKVIRNSVTVKIPQIYTNSFNIDRGIRIDVYQTKGKLDMVLWEYTPDAFTATWTAYDQADITEYVAPIKTFRTILPYSDKAVSGGSDPLPFEQLRLRVIKNAIGPPSSPITSAQIESTLDRKGYDVIKNIDTITDRVYLATKGMPDPVDTNLITAAAASIATLSMRMTEAGLTDTIVNNGASITITPDTLYSNVGGVIKILTSQEKRALLQLPPDKRALMVTSGNYLYSPFHYVLDTTGTEFDLRPYYLDNPEINTKLFVAESATTLIQVSTKAYGIERTASGFLVTIVTKSGDAYKAIADDQAHLQIAFIPDGEKDLAYLNGTYVGRDADNERIYTFDFSTNYNVSKTDKISFSKFFLYTVEPRLTETALTTTFELLYSTSARMESQWVANSIDDKLGRFLLPQRIAGITHEKLEVRFGYALPTLWSRARSVISSVPYQTYDADVPAVYTRNVYATDAMGSAITFDGAGNPVMTLLHAQGSPVLDNEGNPVYKFRKGDVMLDTNNEPVTTDVRGMIRQVDILMIEGAYWFATDDTATKYRTDMIRSLVDRLNNDLASIKPELLELTRIYFYPKTTLGQIGVMVDDGVIKYITASQSFSVNVYVNGAVYDNAALRSKLIKSTVTNISLQLKNQTVSVDAILAALKSGYGEDAISVDISGLGGALNLQTLTVVDSSDRCSIRKRLVALADGKLIVEEDVAVNFVRHVMNT